MKNWKTTLVGLFGAIAMVVGGAANDRANGGKNPLTAGNLIMPIAFAVLGAVAKDHNVTGGTTPQ